VRRVAPLLSLAPEAGSAARAGGLHSRQRLHALEDPIDSGGSSFRRAHPEEEAHGDRFCVLKAEIDADQA
jgi:hypothetical protein